MSEDMVTIRYTVEADAAETLKVPRSQWEAMSQTERDAHMQPFIEGLVADKVDTGYEEI